MTQNNQNYWQWTPNPVYYYPTSRSLAEDIIEAALAGIITRDEARKALKASYPSTFDLVTTQENSE